MDKIESILNEYDWRCEYELSLNKTQSAHARQICSDLIDQICQLFETEAEESRLLTVCQEEIGKRDNYIDYLKESLKDMVWQFGYKNVKDGKPVIHTAGLSALESAFEALGWDDPKYLPEEGSTCEIQGCFETIALGTYWGDGLYLHLCSKHHGDYCRGKERPPVKQYALDREAKRGPDGILKGDK